MQKQVSFKPDRTGFKLFVVVYHERLCPVCSPADVPRGRTTMGCGPMGFNAHTGNTANLAAKFKKKTTKIPVSLKENPVSYCSSETDVEAALSNQDKRGAMRKTFLPLLCQVKS